MMVQYLFSSSEGDVLLDEKTLDRAFLLNPFEAHPFLTLRDYFQSIERFILDRVEVLVEKSKTALSPDRIGEILIRSEKHGTLYHVASVEITGDGTRSKFAVSTAFSEPRKEVLLHEYRDHEVSQSAFLLRLHPESLFGLRGAVFQPQRNMKPL